MVASTTNCILRKEVTELGASLLDTSEKDSLYKANHNKQKVSHTLIKLLVECFF